MAKEETASPGDESTCFLMRAIDGSHLKWHEFRAVVLDAFRIVLTEKLAPSEMPRPVSERLTACLQNLTRFSSQEQMWRRQLTGGHAFGVTGIFPPNVLPPLQDARVLQRCQAPKMNREALPPRVAKTQSKSPFELSAPRPALITGFTVAAFNETEWSMLPNCISATGTLVDFGSGCVTPGTASYGPFLVFERIATGEEDGLEIAKNHCAVAGAHCVRSLQLFFRQCNCLRPAFERPMSFTCAIDNTLAVIHYHYMDPGGRYCMSEVARFPLQVHESFCEFQGWIEAIEEWGSTFLLPVIKVALLQLAKTNRTPPISPMPSLALSIDTNAGGDDGLMKSLRATFGAITWKCEGDEETPMNSSIAHCGTPFGARRMRVMAMSPTTPLELPSALSNSPTPFSAWRMKPEWANKSPVARRHPLSPLKIRSDLPDSPCRPATLSPCSPHPEAPYSAKAPILVLQKRVDLAMNEIQELRIHVEILQKELSLKSKQDAPTLDIDPAAGYVQELGNPVATKKVYPGCDASHWPSGSALVRRACTGYQAVECSERGQVFILLLVLSLCLGHNVLEVLFHAVPHVGLYVSATLFMAKQRSCLA